MSKIIETSLIIKRETIIDKIRKSLLVLIYKDDYQMIQRLDELIMPKRPKQNSKIVIPQEIGKSIIKYK